jgi:hypothetical protein
MKDYTDYELTEDRILRVIRDESAESPDDWGNTDMFLIYDHRQFNIKRKGFDPEDIAQWYQASFRTLDYEGYHVFPVAAYIHSGVSLSLTDSLKRQGWDTSVRGFILVAVELGKSEEKAKEYAQGLIDTWNQYLSGDVWGFELFEKVKYLKFKKEDLDKILINEEVEYCDLIKLGKETVELEEEDSCWGFYGSDPKTNGMLEHFDYKLVETVEKGAGDDYPVIEK